MTDAPWYVKSARDALEMGYRCIAERLNAILDQNAPGLAIRADPPRLGDSMKSAMGQFRRAMAGLRTLRELPDQNAGISPWTLGYVNDTGNPPTNVPLSTDWELFDPFIFDFLSTGRSTWKPEHWKRFIVDRVELHMAESRSTLEEFSRLANSKSGESWRQAANPDDLPLPKPKHYANGWAAIASTLEQHNDAAFQKRIRVLHSKYPSPIQFGGKGFQPTAEKRKLIEWWNSLEERFSEIQSREINRQHSTARKHSFGRAGSVIPEIQGHETKRRPGKNGELRQSSD